MLRLLLTLVSQLGKPGFALVLLGTLAEGLELLGHIPSACDRRTT